MLIVPIMIFAIKAGDLENIAAAISSGNSKELATYFDNTVEVKIANKEGAYSKSQAEAIIKDFFTKNPPTLSTKVIRVETMHITPLVI